MCKSRKTPALCLAILSTIVFILGIVIIVMTVGMDAYDSVLSGDSAGVGDLKAVQNVGSAVLWICAILSLLVACAGCAAVKITHRCYIIVYGCCLGSIWLAVLIVGCVFAGTATAAPALMEAACSQGVDTPTNAYQGDAVDQALQIALNGQMCTAVCPCPGSAKAYYDSLSESQMNFFNRTRQFGVGNNTAGQIRMNYANAGTYQNFSSCFDQVIAPKTDEDAAKSIRGLLKVMGSMEKRFSCSGICQPGVFWYTLNVGTPIATQNCISYVQAEISEKYTPVGLAAIASGVVMSLIWLFQYALWCKFDE